jgi:hypothetical protein
MLTSEVQCSSEGGPMFMFGEEAIVAVVALPADECNLTNTHEITA